LRVTTNPPYDCHPRLPGLTAEAYLRQSILKPDACVAPGFPAGVMYPNFEKTLTDRELNDLVAFLLSLQ
jgi:hypothetical protein